MKLLNKYLSLSLIVACVLGFGWMFKLEAQSQSQPKPKQQQQPRKQTPAKTTPKTQPRRLTAPKTPASIPQQRDTTTAIRVDTTTRQLQQIRAMIIDSLSGLIQVVFLCTEDSVYSALSPGEYTYSRSDSIIYRLRMGEYKFKFKRRGYEELVRTLRVTEPRVIWISLVPEKPQSELRMPVPALVQILSEPNTADVFLNGQLFGITPIQNSLTPGPYTMVIKKDLFYNDTVKFVLEEGQRKNFYQVLQPNFGVLEIQTLPESDAQVIIDTVVAGTTPYIDQKKRKGEYRIHISKRLFRDTTFTVTVEDMKITRQVIVLRNNFGELTIEAPASQIFVNDTLVGSDRFYGRYLPGRYRLKAERGWQYTPSIKDVTINYDETSELRLDPLPKLGNLSVIVSPFEAGDAEVFVNTEYKGKAPLVFPILIGTYTVEARKQGFGNLFKDFLVREKEMTTIEIGLSSLEEIRQQKIRFWSTSKWVSAGLGVAAVAAATYFQMSAADNHDKYKAATTTEDAVNFRNKVDSNNLSFKISLSITGVTALFSGLAWWIQTNY
jgi:hypothetical protein